MSNHTPSPPFKEMNLMHVPKEGEIYKNKHNDRLVKVVEQYISDTGTIFYAIKPIRDKEFDWEPSLDYNTIRTMNTHWDLVRDDEE